MTASPDPNLKPTSAAPATVSKAGRSPGKTSGSNTTKPKIYAPIPAWGTHGQYGGYFGEQRPGHIHMGLDVDVPVGSDCVAPADGTIGKWAVTSNFAVGEGPQGGGGMIQFIFNSTGDIAAGTVIGWGHVFQCFVHPGEKVKGGQVLGKSGSTNGGAHVHFIQRKDDSAEDGSEDPKPLFEQLQKGLTSPTSGGSGSSGSGSGSSSGDPASIARAAALSTFIQLPGIFDTFESQALKGKKSLLNDQPLLPFIEQLCQASLRNFQSMPNGNFYAFFPDYFGGLSGRTAYWEIDDIEVIDGQIDLSDDPLATHVYVVGDVALAFGTIDINDILFSSGVVTIFDAFASDFLTGSSDTAATQTAPKSPKSAKTKGTGSTASTPQQQQALTQAGESAAKAVSQKNNTLAFLQKYGARPLMEEAPMVRSPFFELFLAYQKFMLMWAQQFMTTFTFTFMPELFPGGIVSFPTHGIQCYVAEVTHSFDYEHGFTTQANLMAPAALPHSKRPNVHEGMIRAFTLGDELPFDPFADSRKKRSQKK